MIQRFPRKDAMLTGVVIITSKNYDPNKPATGHIFGHGQGQRGSDSAINVETWFKDECQDLITLIENSNSVLIAPNLISGDWSLEYFDFAYDYLMKNYKVDSKVKLSGVSLGGQIIYPWAANNPLKVAAVFSCCCVWVMADYCKIKVPVMLAHAKDDKTVYPVNSESVRDQINVCNPPQKVIYKEVPTGGHSIWKDIFKDPEVQKFLTGQAVSNPVPPVINPPISVLKADASATLTSVVGTTAILDGTKSVGYKKDKPWNYMEWKEISTPPGPYVDIWDMPDSGKIGEKINLKNLRVGSSVFGLTVRDEKGKSETTSVTITVSKVGKEIEAEFDKDGKHYILYKDKTWV